MGQMLGDNFMLAASAADVIFIWLVLQLICCMFAVTAATVAVHLLDSMANHAVSDFEWRQAVLHMLVASIWALKPCSYLYTPAWLNNASTTTGVLALHGTAFASCACRLTAKTKPSSGWFTGACSTWRAVSCLATMGERSGVWAITCLLSLRMVQAMASYRFCSEHVMLLLTLCGFQGLAVGSAAVTLASAVIMLVTLMALAHTD